MNEVTKVHLGRQAFTIAVDARKALQAYIDAIKHQVGDKSGEVIKEVELRMAELLIERGISSEKVVLPEDVEFLKEQLGEPKDFKEDNDETRTSADTDKAEELAPKRLFRDTENAMLAGVASGLANYFGIDVLFIRILFIIAVITGGWGILLYILLWVLVPEAKSSSDRLQMQGKAVTVASLKEVVNRADVGGAAHRAGEAIARADVGGAAHRAGGVVMPLINSCFRLVAKLVGVVFIVTAFFTLFGLIAIGVYSVLHHGKLFQEGFFPVGPTEVLLFVLVLVMCGIIALFLLFIGIAHFRRKWPIPTWITFVIGAMLLVSFAVSAALAADAAPRVRDRFNAAHHTVSRSVEPFQGVDTKNSDAGFTYQYSDTYSVEIRYIGSADVSQISTKVENGQLVIDSQKFLERSDCSMICLFPRYDLQIIVRSPIPPMPPFNEEDHYLPPGDNYQMFENIQFNQE
jgi:phage shock protein PspC (stress-responsive transcriptional regulator)